MKRVALVLLFFLVFWGCAGQEIKPAGSLRISKIRVEELNPDPQEPRRIFRNLVFRFEGHDGVTPLWAFGEMEILHKAGSPGPTYLKKRELKEFSFQKEGEVKIRVSARLKEEVEPWAVAIGKIWLENGAGDRSNTESFQFEFSVPY